ncbi:C4-dicarboxylate ABC transporter permease [Virgibacillus dokdonensis]|uniref:C4-dicarboxylate ABC transporter permease n=1 Tax=Virgibacillus dokdonensis TaxID=302167 RepID=A0A3E0WRU5_9BACI|nr:TRAP transporter permease [Virgibacillus dokdonensis]RFA34697.1 C4-dicarboxylate ABC transporter permease [Virgibacillus dokdonensis]
MSSGDKLQDYERESNVRTHLPRGVRMLFVGIAVALGLFHLYTSYGGALVDIKQRSIHLYTLMMLAFLLYPITKKKKRNKIPIYDYMLAGASLVLGIYMLVSATRIIESGGQINHIDVYVGMVVIIVLFEITRRVTGWGLTLLAFGFLVYGFYVKLSIYPQLTWDIIINASSGIIAHLVYITEGVLGTAIGVSASYIILFILFGAFLSKSGMGQLFNDIAMAVAGHTKGGPAKVAVLASGFLGSINGSAIANVVTTGAFTIPLMKKVGYHKNFAGAVESASSVGGQILPPIMGAAAFIMAENLGIPYTTVILAGIIPALLFYFGILLQVHIRASKLKLKGLDKNELPTVKTVLMKRGHLLIPMIILLYLLFSGKTPFYAAFWSIIATVLITGTGKMLFISGAVSLFLLFEPQIGAVLAGASIPELRDNWFELGSIITIPLVINFVRKQAQVKAEEIHVKDFVDALENGVRTTIPVAVACGAVGIIVGVSSLTGVALEIASSIVSIGDLIQSPFFQLLITLFLTMIASIILGMGLPSIPTYIITSTMAAPILLQLPYFRELTGAGESAVFVAHMFVFYFGIFANITPPVALAAFAGAGISGGEPMRTGFQAMKLAIAGFIVPFMFVFSNQMLMMDATIGNIFVIMATSLPGVFLLSVAVEGYFKRSLAWYIRIIATIGALLLIYPGVWTDMAGLVALLFVLVTSLKRKNGQPASENVS